MLGAAGACALALHVITLCKPSLTCLGKGVTAQSAPLLLLPSPACREIRYEDLDMLRPIGEGSFGKVCAVMSAPVKAGCLIEPLRILKTQDLLPR